MISFKYFASLAPLYASEDYLEDVDTFYFLFKVVPFLNIDNLIKVHFVPERIVLESPLRSWNYLFFYLFALYCRSEMG